MGGDSLAVMTPIITLGRLVAIDRSFKQEDLHVAETRRLTCNPKGFWRTWREEILKPHHDWRISTRELVLQVKAKSKAGSVPARVLVDTGAKIPLVFRRDLFPRTCLKKARQPVVFSTVNGDIMEGGTHGLFLEFWLPVYKKGRLITARTCSLFAYEANVQNVDIIMGYPF